MYVYMLVLYIHVKWVVYMCNLGDIFGNLICRQLISNQLIGIWFSNQWPTQ